MTYYQTSTTEKFVLDPDFVESFKDKPEPFGFNGLGHIVYLRTYSRIQDDGTKERWYQTVARVVNGTYNMQKQWVEGNDLGWKPEKAQRSAKEMYSRIFELKFSPPGRGLWAMGSPLTETKQLYATLNNCAFVSTEEIEKYAAKPFTFLMDASMLGIGVGFDTKGAGKLLVRGVNTTIEPVPYVIPDSREGWVESTRLLLESYFYAHPKYNFDYSHIRPAGQPIKNFGGVSSGPGALQDLHAAVEGVLQAEVGRKLSTTAIVDIMNHIGVCVVSGNVRRTAEIAFGSPDDVTYIDLKNYEKNPHRMAYGWTSNNSIFAELGMNYAESCERVQQNGEPGFAWLENMRSFGRMNGTADNRDRRAMGGNPCLEQTLEPFEMCCLVETFPQRHETKEDFLRTLKFAYLYAKTVTLGRTHWAETNRVMLRNRRIGCSMSGIAQFITHRGLHQLRTWANEGYDVIQNYDRIYSEWLAIPRSIKTTSIKPSGTVSLLAGATPGMHYPISRFYIRRVRMPKESDLLGPLETAGYKIEPCVGSENTTVCVEFPIDVGEGIRKNSEVTMWEQLNLAAFLQEHWSDNQVSCTVTFDPKVEGAQIQHALDYFQYRLKGISFLPNCTTVYPQLPYEEIDEQRFTAISAQITQIQFKESKQEAVPDRFCDGDKCTL